MFLQSPTQVIFHKLESSFTSHASQFSFIHHLTANEHVVTNRRSVLFTVKAGRNTLSLFAWKMMSKALRLQ